MATAGAEYLLLRYHKISGDGAWMIILEYTYQRYRSRCKKSEFTANNQMANAYYHNMANQHQSWQSYFVDQKK